MDCLTAINNKSNNMYDLLIILYELLKNKLN